MTCSPLIKTKISKSQVTLWIMLFPNRRTFSNRIIHFPEHVIEALVRGKYWKTVICGATNSFWRLAVFYCLRCRLPCVLKTSCDLNMNSVGFIASLAPQHRNEKWYINFKYLLLKTQKGAKGWLKSHVVDNWCAIPVNLARRWLQREFT